MAESQHRRYHEEVSEDYLSRATAVSRLLFFSLPLNLAVEFFTSSRRCVLLLLHSSEIKKHDPLVVVVVVAVVVFTLKNHPGLVSIQYFLLSQHQSLYSSC